MKRYLLWVCSSLTMLATGYAHGADLKVSNRTDKILLVQRLDNKDPNKIKEQKIIPAYGKVTFHSGFYNINLLQFHEFVGNEKEMEELKKYTFRIGDIKQYLNKIINIGLWDRAAIINPQIRWSDLSSEIIYFARNDIAIHNDQTKEIKKVEIPLAIAGIPLYVVALSLAVQVGYTIGWFFQIWIQTGRVFIDPLGRVGMAAAAA